MLMLLLKIIIPSAWILNIYFTIFFIFSLLRQEKNRKTIIATLCFIAAGMVCIESGINLRDGYDEQIVMQMLTTDFFATPIFKFKEISAIFTADTILMLFGNNLKAVLLFNSTLPFVSLLLLFAILKKFKLSTLSSITASAFLFLNFNMTISSISMALTSYIIFIFLCSIASSSFSFDSFHSNRTKFRLNLVYFFSALALLITARAELAPVPASLFLISFYLSWRNKNIALNDLKTLDLVISIIGISACLTCSFEEFNQVAHKTMAHNFYPYRSIVYHLVAYNLSVLFDNKLYTDYEADIYMSMSMQLLFIALSAFIAIGIYNFIKQKEKINNKKNIIFYVFIIYVLYTVNMYAIRDHYHLQFVRHNVICLTVFAFVFAFAIEGYRNIFIRHKKNFVFLICLFIFFYFGLNAQTAFSLNNERRTNDRLWQLLISAQKHLKGKYNIIAPYDYQLFFQRFFSIPNNNSKKTICFISPELYAENIIKDNLMAHNIFLVTDIYKEYNYKPIPQIPVSFGFSILKENYEMDKYFTNFNKEKINIFINELQKDIAERQDSKLKIAYLILALSAANQEYKAKQTLKKYDKIFSGYGKELLTLNKFVCIDGVGCNTMNSMLYAIENISADKNKFIFEMVKAREFGRPEYLLDFIVSVYQFPLHPYEDKRKDTV